MAVAASFLIAGGCVGSGRPTYPSGDCGGAAARTECAPVSGRVKYLAGNGGAGVLHPTGAGRIFTYRPAVLVLADGL